MIRRSYAVPRDRSDERQGTNLFGANCRGLEVLSTGGSIFDIASCVKAVTIVDSM